MIFKKLTLKPVLLAAAVAVMLGSVAASEWAKPVKHWSDAIGTPHYADLMPKSFGDWQALENAGRAMVNPVQEQRLMELYTETLARAYVNKRTGRVIMLSVAYGKDQSSDTQLHTPEQCYPSQGFKVVQREDRDIQTAYGTIPAVRMLTELGDQRSEPLTYFIRVGNGLVRGSKDRNLARLNMAVKGYLVDGALFRVSEVTRADDSLALQEQFIKEMLASMSSQARGRVMGGMPTPGA
jgi:EpsI family protein